VSVVLLALSLLCGQSAKGSDWPQLPHDAAHTGYTADQPEPPFGPLWHRDLRGPMATANQVIVADGGWRAPEPGDAAVQ
jgi:hypothetical protein